MTFRVGQKVVCINVGPNVSPLLTGVWIPDGWRADTPIINSVYTVDAIVGLPGNRTGLVLAEIKNTATWKFAFDMRRFRPIVERKTDISVFKRMLTPIGIDA